MSKTRPLFLSFFYYFVAPLHENHQSSHKQRKCQDKTKEKGLSLSIHAKTDLKGYLVST